MTSSFSYTDTLKVKEVHSWLQVFSTWHTLGETLPEDGPLLLSGFTSAVQSSAALSSGPLLWRSSHCHCHWPELGLLGEFLLQSLYWGFSQQFCIPPSILDISSKSDPLEILLTVLILFSRSPLFQKFPALDSSVFSIPYSQHKEMG